MLAPTGKRDLAAATVFAIIAAIGLGLLLVLLEFRRDDVASSGASPRPHVAMLWALACLSLGAVVGFLFAIPKIFQSSGEAPTPGEAGAAAAAVGSYRLMLNTNLEQVSDWLTKIIVGVGLVELREIPAALQTCADYVAKGIGVTDGSVAMALILYFLVCGFLGTYIVMRLYVTRAFSEADQLAQLPLAKLREEIQRSAEDAPTKIDPGTAPSEHEIGAAKRVARLALQVDDRGLRKQVDELAREYETTRASMRPGPERTSRMQVVVNKMKTLGLGVDALLPELVASDSPGHRLMAIASLQIKPEAKYLAWLGTRFDAETPFVAYQAAVALVAAVKLFPASKADLAAALAMAKGSKIYGEDQDTRKTLDVVQQRLDAA